MTLRIPTIETREPKSLTLLKAALLAIPEDQRAECLWRLDDIRRPVAEQGLGLDISVETIRIRHLPSLARDGFAYQAKTVGLGVRSGAWLVGHPDAIAQARRDEV